MQKSAFSFGKRFFRAVQTTFLLESQLVSYSLLEHSFPTPESLFLLSRFSLFSPE